MEGLLALLIELLSIIHRDLLDAGFGVMLPLQRLNSAMISSRGHFHFAVCHGP
jgi:hypothetical protein